MPDAGLIIFFIGFILLVAYVLLIIFFTRGWRRIAKASITSEKRGSLRLSVLIPFRNESRNLEQILSCLLSVKSDYILEVILINDQSEDDSFSIAKSLEEKYEKVILLNPGAHFSGKKNALQAGLNCSKGNLIATLDADIIISKQWAEEIADHFTPGTHALILPVAYSEDISPLFHLEFIALQVVTFGSIGRGFPLLNNGANMVYSKEALMKIDGFNSSAHKSSGDDIFTLMAIVKEYGRKSVKAVLNNDVIGITSGPANMKEFMLQRLRWAGKTIFVRNAWFSFVAWLVLLTNLVLAFILIISVFILDSWLHFIILFSVKLIFDFILLKPALKFYNAKKLIKWFIPASVLYLFYVSLLSIFSRILKPQWKGRKVK